MSRTLSIAIPTFNRTNLLFESFSKVIDNELVDEVVIVDDASDENIYKAIEERAKQFSKIRLYQNDINKDCYRNKFTAVSYAKNDWCILLDSDNQIDFDYLSKLLQLEKWDENTAYLPSFAAPFFNYKEFEGITITKENVAKYIHNPTFTCCLNTANFFVNKNFYMKCWDGDIDPHTSDSIYMNYLWLKNGGKLYIVPGLTYQHRVDDHEDEEPGHYKKNQHKTGNFHAEIEQKLRELK